jgi:ACS family tartrate transporter-like MFS transporter
MSRRQDDQFREPDDLPVARQAQRKVYLHVILPLFITSIIAYLDRVNLSYAGLKMNDDLKFSNEVFGLGAGIFFAGYVLLEIPGALIAERYSPRWWLARIMLSWGLLSGLMAFVQTPFQFYVVRFFLGVAEASLYPVLYASCIPRWFPPAERPQAIAVMLTSLQISSIIGAPLAGWLLGQAWFGFQGWQILFLVEAIPAVLFAFVLVWWTADTPAEARWLTEHEREYLERRLAAGQVSVARHQRYTVAQALANPEVLKLALTYFLWITGFWGATYWMPKVLKEQSGWSNLAVGWMLVVPMILSLLFMLAIARSSTRTGEKRWHGAVGLFLGAVGLILGALATNQATAYVALCLALVGVYAPFGVWWSYPTTFLTGAAAAGAIGLINSLGNVGGFIGPYLTGYLKEKTGSYSAAWMLLAVSLLFSGLLMLTLGRKRSTTSPDL